MCATWCSGRPPMETGEDLVQLVHAAPEGPAQAPPDLDHRGFPLPDGVDHRSQALPRVGVRKGQGACRPHAARAIPRSPCGSPAPPAPPVSRRAAPGEAVGPKATARRAGRGAARGRRPSASELGGRVAPARPVADRRPLVRGTAVIRRPPPRAPTAAPGTRTAGPPPTREHRPEALSS